MQTIRRFDPLRWEVFSARAEAEEIMPLLASDPEHHHEIREDPKKTGKCIISAYDRRTGKLVGHV